MLRVLHVTGVYLPYIGGSSLRLSSLLKPLVEGDYCEFHILVPKRDIHGKDIYRSDIKEHESIGGLHVHRVERTLNMVKAIRKICKEADIDIIHAHNPRFALVSLLALTGKTLILETHTVRQVSPVKELMTRLTYKLCDRIIVLSNSMKEELTRTYRIPAYKIQVIYNGVDQKKFAQRTGPNFLRRKYQIPYSPGDFVDLCYFTWYIMVYRTATYPALLLAFPQGDESGGDRILTRFRLCPGGSFDSLIWSGFQDQYGPFRPHAKLQPFGQDGKFPRGIALQLGTYRRDCDKNPGRKKAFRFQ